MKRLIIFAGLFLACSSAWAVSDVWKSSMTATADTTKTVCPKNYTTKLGKGVFHGVCIDNSVTGLTGTFTVYNASAAATNPMAVIWTGSGSQGCMNYDVQFSSGLSYTSVSTATVTLLYNCQD